MAIDYTKEDLIEFRTALNNHFPGRRPCFQTGYRWAGIGVKLNDGSRLVLETLIIGGVRYTSTEAIQKWIDGQNVTLESKRLTSKAKQKTRIEIAKSKLKGLGLAAK